MSGSTVTSGISTFSFIFKPIPVYKVCLWVSENVIATGNFRYLSKTFYFPDFLCPKWSLDTASLFWKIFFFSFSYKWEHTNARKNIYTKIYHCLCVRPSLQVHTGRRQNFVNFNFFFLSACIWIIFWYIMHTQCTKRMMQRGDEIISGREILCLYY